MSLRAKLFIIFGVVIAFVVFVIIILSGSKGDVVSVSPSSVSSFPAPPIGSPVQERGLIGAGSLPATKATPVSDGERQLEALSRDGWRVVGVLQDAPDLAELLLMRADAAPAVS